MTEHERLDQWDYAELAVKKLETAVLFASPERLDVASVLAGKVEVDALSQTTADEIERKLALLHRRLAAIETYLERKERYNTTGEW